MVADLSSSPSLFFFLINIMVADLSSFSSNSDRIRPNWGCFSQFLSQLRWILAQIGPNQRESAQIGANRGRKKKIYIYIYVLNYQLSQKLKLLENCEFNHLTISLTLPLTCGSKLPFNKWGPNKWEFNILNGR